MVESVKKRGLIIVSTCVFLLGLAAGTQEVDPPIAGNDGYFEVNGPGVPYVPMTAEYVKLDGRIRKVARFASAISTEEGECPCPKCCSGYCYVIIFTDVVTTGGPIRVLYVLWLEC